MLPPKGVNDYICTIVLFTVRAAATEHTSLPHAVDAV